MTRDHFLLSTRPPPIRGLVLSVVSFKTFHTVWKTGKHSSRRLLNVEQDKVQPKLT